MMIVVVIAKTMVMGKPEFFFFNSNVEMESKRDWIWPKGWAESQWWDARDANKTFSIIQTGGIL